VYFERLRGELKIIERQISCLLVHQTYQCRQHYEQPILQPRPTPVAKLFSLEISEAQLPGLERAFAIYSIGLYLIVHQRTEENITPFIRDNGFNENNLNRSPAREHIKIFTS